MLAYFLCFKSVIIAGRDVEDEIIKVKMLVNIQRIM